MSYTAPVTDMLFTLRHVAGLDALVEEGLFPDLDPGTVEALLGQAGDFAGGVLAPLNRIADTRGISFTDGVVRTPPGFADAYRQWSEGGWNAVAAPETWGGFGLPVMLNTACIEMWTSACMAFATGPVLTQGAVDALLAHGSDELRAAYLPKLVTGEWAATMNLTEPQAGSDLSLLRTRAEPAGDGATYRLTGQKIYITYGEHDLTDNIVHLVLARLPDAPAGTKGISLLLVPKVLPDGTRNDVRCTGVEHKLGLHGSPTCTMVYGDRGGATGWLVGRAHQGLVCMFTMMNRARLATGLQGVAVAERAYQQALAFAKDRRQGRASGVAGAAPIVEHPDVRRMLMTMRALTAAGRAVAYITAEAIDRAERGHDAAARARADLLTPVAKAFCSDLGAEVASLGIQVHGGMGYVEETGAAQHWRDVRVAAIYEGSNGVQAIDLVTRKLPRDGGVALSALAAGWHDTAAEAARTNDPALGGTAKCLSEALAALDEATAWLLAPGRDPEEALASASSYLRLLGLTTGGAMLAKGALAALRHGDSAGPNPRAHVVAARFYTEHLATAAPGLARSITEGAGSIRAAREALAR